MTEAVKTVGFWARVQRRWGVTPWGAVAILLSFALAGMTVLKISRPLINFLLPAHAPRWQWWTLRLLVVPPIYEVLLLGYGTLLGQREFFWSKLKRLGGAIARPFRRA